MKRIVHGSLEVFILFSMTLWGIEYLIKPIFHLKSSLTFWALLLVMYGIALLMAQKMRLRPSQKDLFVRTIAGVLQAMVVIVLHKFLFRRTLTPFNLVLDYMSLILLLTFFEFGKRLIVECCSKIRLN